MSKMQTTCYNLENCLLFPLLYLQACFLWEQWIFAVLWDVLDLQMKTHSSILPYQLARPEALPSWLFHHHQPLLQRSAYTLVTCNNLISCTLPKTIIATQKWWLEYYCPSKMVPFHGTCSFCGDVSQVIFCPEMYGSSLVSLPVWTISTGIFAEVSPCPSLRNAPLLRGQTWNHSTTHKVSCLILAKR